MIVVAAFGAVLSTAAVATVAQVAIVGAVTGAIVGGVTAAIKGENILEGALKGGVIGGLAGAAGAVVSGAPTAIEGSALPTAAQSTAAEGAYSSAVGSGIAPEVAKDTLSQAGGTAALSTETAAIPQTGMTMIGGQTASSTGGQIASSTGGQIASSTGLQTNTALSNIPTTHAGLLSWAKDNPQLAAELAKGTIKVGAALLEPSAAQKATLAANAIKAANLRHYIKPTKKIGLISAYDPTKVIRAGVV